MDDSINKKFPEQTKTESTDGCLGVSELFVVCELYLNKAVKLKHRQRLQGIWLTML